MRWATAATSSSSPSDGSTRASSTSGAGLAGDVVQAFVNYRLRLVVVGALPETAVASEAFGAFVREANRGSQTWFVASEAGLRQRLAEAAEPGS